MATLRKTPRRIRVITPRSPAAMPRGTAARLCHVSYWEKREAGKGREEGESQVWGAREVKTV